MTPIGRALALIAAAGIAACASTSDKPDNAAAFADIQDGKSGDEVVVEGIVTDVDRSLPGPYGTHERFTIRIDSGAAEQDVDVADNVTIGEVAPLRRGDDVVVKGVLEIDPSGPILHWTHHDPELRHPSGFVEVGGTRYE